MKLVPSTEQDIERLTAWIEADPYHKDCLNPMWWLTGADHGCLLAFRLDDDHGALCYVRLDQEVLSSRIRLHTQFAPIEQVSKLRLVKGMLKCIPVIEDFCTKQNASGIIFQSVSPLLIDFMDRKFGFKPAGGDDYLLKFEDTNASR
jgi:hypothetical protein